jgi:hypothetical protein
MKSPRLQFSLRALLLCVVFAGLVAGWIGRAEQQRRAISALRKLDEYECVFYSFQHEGACANVMGRKYEPWRFIEFVGLDPWYSVTNVFVDAEKLELALPHLRRLYWLKEIWVSTGRDDEPEVGEEAIAARLKTAIERLRHEFPSLKVEEHPGCPITVTRIPVVG